LVIEAALFDSGRPVLIVPYIQAEGLSLKHGLVCWDGSRNAARAIADAQPFLARAKAIEVVTVGTDLKSTEVSGADIANHFAGHSLNVELKKIAITDVDVPNAILSRAADVSADLIVMGGYGHSRLREFFLGGATRGILAAMTVPTIMSHSMAGGSARRRSAVFRQTRDQAASESLVIRT
jgi:nucleotide-binding universal stress UspA family protein